LVLARTLLACVCSLAGAVFGTSAARADDETVLLMVPQTPEPALVELFHRVEAELRLHQFRPEVLVATPGDSTESLLGAQASAQRAFAAIAIVEQAQAAMLHVWIVDSRTGLTRQYRVTQQGGEEPVNVVAVRAIDLLRANRTAQLPPSAAGENARVATGQRASAAGSSAAGAATSAATPDRAAAGAEPSTRVAPSPADGSQPTAAAPGPRKAAASPTGRDGQPATDRKARSVTAGKQARETQSDAAADSGTTEVVIEDTSAPETSHYKPKLLQIATEVVALSLSRRMGWSFGPSIGAWLTLAERLRIGMVGVAPLWGATLHAPLGDPAVWQELLWLELSAVLLRAGPLQLSAAGGGGLHWLQARGRAAMPYRSNNASTWSWTASLATRADVMLAEHWSLGMTLRARVFLPPVEVAVETESARLATPAIEGALGLSLWL